MPVNLPLRGRYRPELMFRPRSLALIGADTARGATVLANLRAAGFKGRLDVVARGADLRGSGDAPADLGLICDTDVVDGFERLAEAGTRAAIVFGPATGETGEIDCAALAGRTGVRAFGPHSFGLAVPSIGLDATLGHLPPRNGRLALVSQSASFCRVVLDWAEPNGVGFSHIVGIGSNHDLGFAGVLDWLSRDAGTGAILLDIRRIKDARRFLSAARAAARLRPVVAMRAGGLVIDPDGEAEAAFSAALRRCGVLGVEGAEDLLAAAETLTRARPARGERLAIVGNALGPSQLVADAAVRDGLSLATYSEATRTVLRLAVPDLAEKDVIVLPPDQSVRLAEVASMLSAAPDVGGVVVVHAPRGSADDAAMQAIAAAHQVRVPLLGCVMGETTGAAHRRVLATAGVPVFASPAQAVRGFLHLVQDRRNRAAARELPARDVLRVRPDHAAVRHVFGRVRAEGRASLFQDEALSVLEAYGVPVVPGRAVADATGAEDAAALFGFPLVIKRRRATRADAPGVMALALDLTTPAELREAARRLTGRDGAPDGLLVQRQVGRARELLIRVRADALFGPVIVFGQGGTAADILRDFAADLPPLNLSLAHLLIARTRVSRTLGALHDQPAADEQAVADTLVRVSQLLVDFPDIDAVEINPLFADAQGVLAADAWISLRAAGAAALKLALPPYPAEWSAGFDMRGERLLVRPIRPEDAEAHAAMFAKLPPEDIRFRFFSALRELTPETIARLTQIDYDREIAFVAVRETTGETLGVSRLVREGDGGEGEFAVLVTPEAKGQGLAGHLMGRLVDWARAQAMTAVVGQILADNAPMLAFVRKLGFRVSATPGDPGVMTARLDL